MTGWRDAPLVEAKGSWRDAPLVADDVMATPAPGHTRPFTREDLAANQGLYAPLHPGDILGGLAMAAPEASEMAANVVAGAVRKVAPAVTGAAHWAGKAVVPAGGALLGYGEGSQIAHGLGLPGWVGGVPGAAIGAIMPSRIAALRGGAKGVLRAVAEGAAPAAAEAAPVLAKAAPAVAKVAEEAPAIIKATIANRDDVFVVGSRVFTTQSDAVQAAHAARRAGETTARVIQAGAPTVTKAAPTTAEVASRTTALMQFAKDVAARQPKLGEKIHILLDRATGLPVRVLTPDQAGAAKRAGESTTWVKNVFQ